MVGVGSMADPLKQGLPCDTGGTEPGFSQVRSCHAPDHAPGSSCGKRPRGDRAAIHQHHFYTASALAVDVPHGGAGAPP